MELTLIRSLMDKDFYDETRGNRCPEKLFTKDIRKIKSTIDTAMDQYQRDLTVDEQGSIELYKTVLEKISGRLIYSGTLK